MFIYKKVFLGFLFSTSIACYCSDPINLIDIFGINNLQSDSKLKLIYNTVKNKFPKKNIRYCQIKNSTLEEKEAVEHKIEKSDANLIVWYGVKISLNITKRLVYVSPRVNPNSIDSNFIDRLNEDGNAKHYQIPTQTSSNRLPSGGSSAY